MTESGAPTGLGRSPKSKLKSWPPRQPCSIFRVSNGNTLRAVWLPLGPPRNTNGVPNTAEYSCPALPWSSQHRHTCSRPTNKSPSEKPKRLSLGGSQGPTVGSHRMMTRMMAKAVLPTGWPRPPGSTALNRGPQPVQEGWAACPATWTGEDMLGGQPPAGLWLEGAWGGCSSVSATQSAVPCVE